MNQDKKLRLLLVPLILMILLFFPGMILDNVPNAYIQGMPDAVRMSILEKLMSAVIIWTILFYHIPTGVYTAIVVVYTVVSWMWILKQKKGNALYFIVWMVLCVLSIFMYWVVGPEYYSMINM